MEIDTGRTEVIFYDPQYDVNTVVIHPDTYEIQMVSFDFSSNGVGDFRSFYSRRY